ncbi:MAG: hypothetical protein KAI47_21750 [Deltaproteobacteria bacterium]|nr:hypothetical protein [Deltaproteobacteria bacterium]
MKRLHRTLRDIIGSRWIGRLGLLAAFVSTTALAQGDKPAAPKTAAAPAKRGAEVKFRKASQLTATEQLSQGNLYTSKMRTVLQRVTKLSKRARTDKDLIKLNCVNDKLVRIKGNLRLSEQIQGNLKTAAARHDAGARSHEFAKLTITYQKVTVLGQEAEACIGEEISFVGKAKVTVQIDPDVARQGDPTIETLPPLPTIRPPLASPFL